MLIIQNARIKTMAGEEIKNGSILVENGKIKEVVEGKFNKEAAIKEFNETYKKISLDMEQMDFQREVGRLEVLGELLIRDKTNKND